jgi:predicted TIM-barrel fold metal-dependent hydrolase
MAVDAIDMHVHFYTGPPAEGLSEAKKLFASAGSTEQILEYYTERNLAAVVFDIDKETTTGRTIDNGAVARLVEQSAGRFRGFASVDPWKGADAITELARCVDLGLTGLKMHPITQQFDLGDPQFYPIWEFCQEHSWPLLVHTGTTGIGSGAPGGKGFRLRYAHPFPAIDDLAAEFAELNIIAAHYGWPWYLELLAVAKHKGNVYIDLSGWAPKYLPEDVRRYMNSVMPEKFLFGSDFPLLSPERWLKDFAELDLKDEVREMVLRTNSQRLFRWEV